MSTLFLPVIILKMMLFFSKCFKPQSQKKIILTVPQHRFLWSVVDEYSFHKRRYTRKELIRKVKDAGFQIVCVTSFVSFLLPLMLLSRIRRQKTRDNFDPVAELKINPCLNMIFENVLAIERTIIKFGFPFPAG